MKMNNIQLKDINFNNYLPLSFGRNYLNIKNSIENVGLINPVILQKTENNNYKIVAGYLRLLALKELNLTEVKAQILNENYNLNKLWALALSTNFNRGFNLAETAIILNKIKDIENNINLKEILNTNKNLKLQENALKAGTLGQQALNLLAFNKLDYSEAALIYNWPLAEQNLILTIFSKLEPSQQKRKQWLELIEDIKRRENLSLKEIFNSPKMDSLLENITPQSEELIRTYLWQRRNPILAKLSLERKNQIKSLKLPKNLKFICDNNFEDLSFAFNLTFSNLEELEILSQKLKEIEKNENFKNLLNLNDSKL